jgi:CheY-like chemotaxis protein
MGHFPHRGKFPHQRAGDADRQTREAALQGVFPRISLIYGIDFAPPLQDNPPRALAGLFCPDLSETLRYHVCKIRPGQKQQGLFEGTSMLTKRILLIEDEAQLRKNLEILLSRAGYSVVAAATGDEGVQYLRTMTFDAVVTDLIMEGFESFELLECVTTYACGVPVIVITGHASTHSATEALCRGAHNYIAKPFSIGVLKAAIENALKPSTAR